jgi:hypothetical protein
MIKIGRVHILGNANVATSVLQSLSLSAGEVQTKTITATYARVI